MENQMYFILMADVINSRQATQGNLMMDFKKIVNQINQSEKKRIISPLTITLGDEFQGVLKGLQAAVEVIIAVEEQIIQQKAGFKLRYVLLEGKIETPINKKNAYEMLGDGLTVARALLSEGKNKNDRFNFNTRNQAQSEAIGNAFNVYQSIVDDWQLDRDYQIITNLLLLKDYKVVADKLNRDRSLIWKRERTAKVKEYISLKKVIYYLIQ